MFRSLKLDLSYSVFSLLPITPMKMCFVKFYTICVLSMSFIFYHGVKEVNGERLQRMVNADDTTVAEFPSNAMIHSVYIENNCSHGSYCGGSLVTPSHILTAAHCTIVHNQSARFVYYRHPSEMFVVLGISSMQEAVHHHIVQRIYRHEQHHGLNYRNPWSSYDVAILELQEPVDLGPTLQIINLPCHPPDLGDQGILVASGCSRLNPPLVGQLQKAAFKVVNCDNWVVIGIICIRSENTIVMPGDSGGAFIINNRIVGIIASAPGHGGYYILTDVFYYFDWIVKIIGLPDEFAFLAGN
ncbi:trypsin eta-like [Diachasmimorpha longicaudata]|uniref:trypsin eta-like n=1 Tax=Diachasmimorpha longicaudata TaxID=58733 RepID=UPI0030B8B898